MLGRFKWFSGAAHKGVGHTSPDLETRLIGSVWGRIGLEFFSNSAHFPIANIFLELLKEGPARYLRAPDLYVILLASSIQAFWLGRWQTGARPRRFWGNLIGPALYTLIETSIEGPGFFTAPHHLGYWCFALVIGGLQSLRLRLPIAMADLSLLLENIVRTGILLMMYWVFESRAHPEYFPLSGFFSDDSHVFVALTIVFLGMAIGLTNLLANGYLNLLRQTASQLKTYSEWLLGRELLGRAVADPETLALARRQRTVLFMDIRGFTRWSEPHSPETVVGMLNDYYRVSEQTLTRHGAIREKFSADEVMAILPTAEAATAAALELQTVVSQQLAPFGLGAGIGVHSGPVVEGVMGGETVKYYDVIGDTVNTAKRLESAAETEEVLISESTWAALRYSGKVGARRRIPAKGKEAGVWVYPLRICHSEERSDEESL